MFPDPLRKLAASELESVDRICNQFEIEWQSGKSPDISAYLQRSDLNGKTNLQTALLLELVRTDIEYRNLRGDTCRPSDYHSLSPEHHSEISSLIASDNKSKSNPSTIPFQNLKIGSEYQIDRFHARGGLGEIYIANDLSLDRKVAVKVPRNRSVDSPDHLRLQREAEVTSRLKHPGIVPVHAISDSGNGVPCYVMQFIEGQTFRDAINQFHDKQYNDPRERFASREFRRLLQRLVSVCNTVAYAHQCGVIHRDIKPGNVMLGEFGETFLLDWGLAKSFNSKSPIRTSESDNVSRAEKESWNTAVDNTPAETKPGQPIGTPEFASPEQIMGRVNEHDQRSDIYSLGATLYSLLTGQRSIDVDDLTNLKTAAALREIESPISLNSSIPADLNAICMKAMAFEAPQRYQTVLELTDELEHFLADEPVSVRKQKTATRLRRWVRKKPRVASSVTTGIVVSLFALTASSYLLTQKAGELSDSLETQSKLNTELENSKESAEDYAAKSMKALRKMSDGVIGQWFARQDSINENERKLLQAILSQYQEFARSKPDEYFTKTVEAEALERVARIQILLGHDDEAVEALTRSVSLLHPLPDEATESTLYLQAACVNELGRLQYERGDIEVGIKHLNVAHQLVVELTSQFPEEPKYLDLFSYNLSQLARMNLRFNNSELALEQLELAKSTTKKLTELHPNDRRILRSHAACIVKIGVTHHILRNKESALDEFDAALSIYESWNADGIIFDDSHTALGYAVAGNGRAAALMALFRNDEAIEQFHANAKIGTRLTKAFPSFPEGYFTLAKSHYGATFVSLIKSDMETAKLDAELANNAAYKAAELAPKHRKYLGLCTATEKRIGSLLRMEGDLEAAEKSYARCVETAEKFFELAPDYYLGPGGAQNRLEYSRVLCWLGRMQYKLDKKENAFSQFERAIELLADEKGTSDSSSSKSITGAGTKGSDADLSNAGYSKTLKDQNIELATILFESGQYQRAMKNWDHAIKLSDANEVLTAATGSFCPTESHKDVVHDNSISATAKRPDQFYYLAALAARANAVDQAIKFLEQAKDLGHFEDQEISDLKSDPLFEAIKTNPKFVEFVDFLRSE